LDVSKNRLSYNDGDDVDYVRTRELQVLVLIAVFGIAAALSYSGFCIKKLGWLSDDEVINAAIGDVLTASAYVTETPTGGYLPFQPKKEVRYRSRDEFRRLNPDCCKIVSHDRFTVGFWDQLFGWAAKSVSLTYTVQFFDENGNLSSQTVVSQRTVGNCGHVFNPGY
jgi:hypothetical protein